MDYKEAVHYSRRGHVVWTAKEIEEEEEEGGRQEEKEENVSRVQTRKRL